MLSRYIALVLVATCFALGMVRLHLTIHNLDSVAV
jgi:hypothetical protein